MKDNPLVKLHSMGQSIWLDYIRRNLMASGELKRLIDEDALRGMTSNPSIFEKAITGSNDYEESIQAQALEGKNAQEIYDALAIEDIQMASDIFRTIYDKEDGRDGYVSLEVSPHLAHETEETIKEARRLWSLVDRPNIFIKVPGTMEGLPAVRQLISEGINVNVTLLFGLPRYRKVAEAYISGLEDRLAQGKPIDHVVSVASFFLSRIDVLVDPMLEKVMDASEENAEVAKAVHGQVAIASAKIAYQIYKEIFSSDRFRKLAEKGARIQRLLWASTSTKNPSYSDVKYVDSLIGSDTINTIPTETLNAYRDHGDPAVRLEDDLDEAYKVMQMLPDLDIDINEVTQQLEDEGVIKFIKPFDSLMEALKKERREALKALPDKQTFDLGKYRKSYEDGLKHLQEQRFVSRLWRKDASLWKEDKKDQEIIENALGWLHVASKMEDNIYELTQFVDEVVAAGFRHIVHMGMGGSSLTPLVFERTFVPTEDGLPLTVLDTTDPQTILELEKKIPVKDTLFIVASKSGDTTEPLAFNEYFYAKVRELKGDAAGENFVAITDPGTYLEKLGKERSYRKIFLNFPDIGGRYSALSYFGLVPISFMCIDVEEVLSRALRMVHACASSVMPEDNPGVSLGVALGELAKQGRDKITFILPDMVKTLGMWLEQLVAESTGKEGKGILPVAGEAIGSPSDYGDDRLFVYMPLKGARDEEMDRKVNNLKEAGHPVITVEMDDPADLGQEFFRWEIAIAVAGSILGINAFNQPNVQESKDNTARLLEKVSKNEKLPTEKPAVVEDPLSIYTDKGKDTVSSTIDYFLEQARPGDYIALMAYIPERAEIEQRLENIRISLRDRMKLATTIGYGPRFLHSTGQYHKGGPNTGLFIQLTADDKVDAQIPGESYSFGTLKHAQAQGDLDALRKHGRRVLRIHLGEDAVTGLVALDKAIQSSLKITA
jgi:transaldolase/glucose-6-phosphate isomerase